MPLTDEEKKKIEEEETYRYQIRTGKSTSAPITIKSQGINWRGIGNATLLFLALIFWPVTFLVYPIWLIHKKTKLSIKNKRVISVIWALFLFGVLQVTWFINRAPNLTILEPTNNFSTWDDNIVITGKVSPAYSLLSVNNGTISNNDGLFTLNAKLPVENNVFIIVATNGGKTKQQTISIVRQLTAEQKAEIQKVQAEADAKRKVEYEKARSEEANRLQEVQAKKDAEERAWKNSTAGQICVSHPSWSREDCVALSERKIWIGMTYDMLVYLRGNPNSINPSNYGNGNRYQYCWHDYNPSCFYDNNDDDIIDAYN